MHALAYRPGDILRRTDSFGLDHDAIADAEGGVIRQVIGRGVIRERFAEFDAAGKARVIEIPDRRFQHDEALRRAQAEVGVSTYNLLTDNCQHFATWCTTGERRSHQVETALVVASAAAGIATLVRLATPVGLVVTAGATLAYLAANAIADRLQTPTTAAAVVSE